MESTSRQKINSVSENGTQTVYHFFSSRIFSFLILCYVFFPIFMILTFAISKTMTILIEFLRNNPSFAAVTDPGNAIMYYIISIPIVALLYMPLFAMKSIYNHAFNKSSIEIISKKITFLSILLIFLGFILLFVFLLLNEVTTYLGNVLFGTLVNWTEVVNVPWNIKMLVVEAIILSGIAVCVMLIVGIHSIDKSLRTDKIYVKGTSAVNLMTIINMLALLVLFVIMLIEQDWIFCLFCAVGITFDVLLVCNVMYYLRIANYSLSTQYSEYIADMHKDEELVYYDKFAQKEEIDAEEMFSQKNEEYIFDPSSKPFDFYSVSEESQDFYDKENRILGTCPACGKPIHDEEQCPFCGYSMKPTQNDEEE